MKIWIVLVLVVAVLVWGLHQRLPRLAANPQSISAIEAYIGQLVAKNNPPGLSVVVVKNELVAYQQAFGWADGLAQQSATLDTVYHWWSMTKVPTAMAVLQLQDAGKLSLDDPVGDYLPFFQVELDGKPAPPITIRQLLRHTSGLPDTVPAMIGWVHYADEHYNQTKLVEEILPEYKQLKFPPDSKFAYSNLGYMVLGAVIEAVSGESYEGYIEAHVLDALGMENTGFIYKPQMAGTIAAGSHPLVSLYTPLLPFLLDTKPLIRERQGTLYWFNTFYIDVTPSTGLIGSVSDAGQLMQGLILEGDILSEEGHQLLLPQGSDLTERPLGWAEYKLGDRTWVQHNGGGPGFATIMRLYPEENLGIVIMSNNTNLPREELVEAFASLEW